MCSKIRTMNPRSPWCPKNKTRTSFIATAVLASQAITKQRALENDFAILQDMPTELKCTEHNGYNTRLCRQADMLSQPHTKVAFLPPLVDQPPAHPDTIKTTIEKSLSFAMLMNFINATGIITAAWKRF